MDVPLPAASAYHWRIDASSYSRSTGHSMNTGPGTPEHATANAWSTAGPISRTRRTLMNSLTCGATSGRWSMSCNAPRPCSAVGAALVSLLKRIESSPRAAAAVLAAHRNPELAQKAAALEGASQDTKARALLELIAEVRRAEPDTHHHH